MWIFYSNLILQENTAEAKILAKTRRDQPTSIIEVATENRSHDRKLSCDLKIEVATRMTKATKERGRDITLMLRRQLNITEVATSL